MSNQNATNISEDSLRRAKRIVELHLEDPTLTSAQLVERACTELGLPVVHPSTVSVALKWWQRGMLEGLPPMPEGFRRHKGRHRQSVSSSASRTPSTPKPRKKKKQKQQLLPLEQNVHVVQKTPLEAAIEKVLKQMPALNIARISIEADGTVEMTRVQSSTFKL